MDWRQTMRQWCEFWSFPSRLHYHRRHRHPNQVKLNIWAYKINHDILHLHRCCRRCRRRRPGGITVSNSSNSVKNCHLHHRHRQVSSHHHPPRLLHSLFSLS